MHFFLYHFYTQQCKVTNWNLRWTPQFYISTAKPTLITLGADIVAVVMSSDTGDEVIIDEVFTKDHVRQATDQ